MTVFVDTSALFAILDDDDQYHRAAHAPLAALAARRETLVTSNYVVVETTAIAGRRLGFQSIRGIQATLAPLLQVHWVGEALHERAMAASLTAGERDLSLVDCVSFVPMRQLSLDTAFAFDAHFVQQGFQILG